MKEGVIIKGIGGFYDVLASDNQVYRCRPREYSVSWESRQWWETEFV